jgi:dienelactone hydrolase
MERQVNIGTENVTLEGTLVVPARANSLVVFAHGSGSSRLSPRNGYVASVLQQAGIGTLLFDLLTAEEDRVYEHRFDIDLLTQRLMGATRWLVAQPDTKEMSIGYFGASTGAAAAIQGAALLGTAISAVVSCGGRPDLAAPYLSRLRAPTLLIVGGLDEQVLQLNRQAAARIATINELSVIPDATHLFEEPGALEQVAIRARNWFIRYLG